MLDASPFWGCVEKTDSCWIWTKGRTGHGYGQFRSRYAHRVSYEMHHGPIGDGLHVLHRCDNPPCVNPAHLFLGTHAENMADMARKGRVSHGDAHPCARLREADVIEIRCQWDDGVPGATLAERFGIREPHVSRIVRGQAWAHLLPPDWAPPIPGRYSRPRAA